MEDFNKFINTIKKVKSKREHKIKHSYGIYDAYKYYKKNISKNSEFNINKLQYSKIVRSINLLLKDFLLEGNDIIFPCRMGKLELLKSYTKLYEDSGVLKNTFPIDWNVTLKLWHEDKEAYNNKTIIKNPVKEVFRVYYNKKTANYLNKSIYDFKLNRDIKIKLKEKIKERQIDAFLKQNYYE